jgi:hypothetical protein
MDSQLQSQNMVGSRKGIRCNWPTSGLPSANRSTFPI